MITPPPSTVARNRARASCWSPARLDVLVELGGHRRRELRGVDVVLELDELDVAADSLAQRGEQRGVGLGVVERAP